MTTQLRDGIDWVGFVDWHVRDFHGYETARGATYNAYLVRADKTALIDTVKGPHADHLLHSVKRFVDLSAVDYIVCNHAEPDHSSGLPSVVSACPNAIVVCTPKCRRALSLYYDTSGWSFREVKTGDRISLGGRTLSFIETPMVHWPDSMFTYLAEDKILFSMDAFGQHYSSTPRFDDENPLPTVMEEARIYYANIVTPYSRRVAETLRAAEALDIEMIAPSHGIVWRSHIDEILRAYENWSECRPKNKVVVMFDTMWNSTAAMADAIHAGASLPGTTVELIWIRKVSLTRIATEVLDAACVAFGSATLNQGMLPMAAAALTYLKGLRFPNRVGVAFGSCGWGKGGAEAVDRILREEMKWEVIREPIKAMYAPGEDVLTVCRDAGRSLARRAAEISAASGYGKLCTDAEQ